MEKKVKDLIQELLKLDQEAVVCRIIDIENIDELEYSSIEVVSAIEKAEYINDKGDWDEGSIIVIY